MERYVTGSQYEGMPSWYDDNVPLFKRGPDIVYPIVETAISSHVSMVLGKMPVLTSAPDEDDEEDGVDAVNELHEAPVNPALHTHGMVLVASADQPAVP